jgi:hypothetical protein
MRREEGSIPVLGDISEVVGKVMFLFKMVNAGQGSDQEILIYCGCKARNTLKASLHSNN